MTIGLPPYAEILRVSVEAEDGAPPVLLMPFADDVLGRPGFLHGGAISGLLEMAAIAGWQSMKMSTLVSRGVALMMSSARIAPVTSASKTVCSLLSPRCEP